jgi:tRNA pseudouridine13 synthase
VSEEEDDDDAPPTLSAPSTLPPELVRAYKTTDVPAISGDARLVPEDFVVEEVPLYEPSGEGEHLYVKIEKRGLSTPEAVSRLARVLKIREREVGYAGMKDAKAITRQTLSFQLVRPESLERFEDPKIKILSVSKHKNKLKLGHLKGNRFTIRLRGIRDGDEASARATLERLAATGAPNYYGLQRFGNRHNSHLLGLELVRKDAKGFLSELLGKPGPLDSPRAHEARGAYERGDMKAALDLTTPQAQAEKAALQVLGREPDATEKAARAVPIRWRRFYAAALQSVLFNRYLTRRLDRLEKLEVGEIAFLNRNGAAFVVENAAKEQARCDSKELSPSGPLFGAKLLRPREGSSPRSDEDAVLAERGLTDPELGDALGAAPRGERRALRVLVADTTLQAETEPPPSGASSLVLSFFLPKGCYATSVLEELLKRPVS